MLSKRLFCNGFIRLYGERILPDIQSQWTHPKPSIVVNENYEEDEALSALTVWDVISSQLGKVQVPVLAWSAPLWFPLSYGPPQFSSVLLAKKVEDTPLKPYKSPINSAESAGDGSFGSMRMSKRVMPGVNRASQSSGDGVRRDGEMDVKAEEAKVGQYGAPVSKDWVITPKSMKDSAEVSDNHYQSADWRNFGLKSSSFPGSSMPPERKSAYDDLISQPQSSNFSGSLNIPQNWNYVKQKILEPSKPSGEYVPESSQANSSPNRENPKNVYENSASITQGYESRFGNPSEGTMEWNKNYADGSFNMAPQGTTNVGSETTKEASDSSSQVATPHITPETKYQVNDDPVSSTSSVNRTYENFRKSSANDSFVSELVQNRFARSSGAAYGVTTPPGNASTKLTKSAGEPINAVTSSPIKEPLTQRDYRSGSDFFYNERKLDQPGYKKHNIICAAKSNCISCSKSTSSCGGGRSSTSSDSDKCAVSCADAQLKSCGEPPSPSGGDKCADAKPIYCAEPPKSSGGDKCIEICADVKPICCAEPPKPSGGDNCAASCANAEQKPCAEPPKCDDKYAPKSCSDESRPKCKETQDVLAKCPGKVKGGSRGGNAKDSNANDKCSEICKGPIGRINPCRSSKTKKK